MFSPKESMVASSPYLTLKFLFNIKIWPLKLYSKMTSATCNWVHIIWLPSRANTSYILYNILISYKPWKLVTCETIVSHSVSIKFIRFIQILKEIRGYVVWKLLFLVQTFRCVLLRQKTRCESCGSDQYYRVVRLTGRTATLCGPSYLSDATAAEISVGTDVMS